MNQFLHKSGAKKQVEQQAPSEAQQHAALDEDFWGPDTGSAEEAKLRQAAHERIWGSPDDRANSPFFTKQQVVADLTTKEGETGGAGKD